MEEFKTYILEELTIGKGSYGIAAPAIPFNPSKHTYLRITDINDDGTLNKQGLMSVDDENASNYILKENDIVFARTGNSTGRSYFYDGADGELVYAGFLIKFSIDKKKVNPRILKYYTHSKPYFNWVRSFDTGGTRGNINAKTYGTMPITLPSREVQDKIVSILKSLDDKIELNHRINGNLEQQVQALFKAWFVDFEPFKNGKFVDSEFGRIPEGWNIVEANHFMTISKDSINPTKNPMCLYTHYSIPAFDEALTPEIQFGHKIKSNKFLVRSGMTLFSKLNPRIKRIWFINEASDNSICSTEFIPYESLGQNSYFLYCYLNSSMFYSQAMSLVNGATGSHQRFSPNETLKFLFAYKKEIVEEFNVLVAPTLKEMSELSLETRKIAKLRDTLLPRLMSGELNINTITE